MDHCVCTPECNKNIRKVLIMLHLIRKNQVHSKDTQTNLNIPGLNGWKVWYHSINNFQRQYGNRASDRASYNSNTECKLLISHIWEQFIKEKSDIIFRDVLITAFCKA